MCQSNGEGKIDEAKYGAMIAALQKFSSTVSTKASSMVTLASVCQQALGQEDVAVKNIYKDIKASQEKFTEVCTEANRIAAALQQELDDAKKEREIWASEE